MVDSISNMQVMRINAVPSQCQTNYHLDLGMSSEQSPLSQWFSLEEHHAYVFFPTLAG